MWPSTSESTAIPLGGLFTSATVSPSASTEASAPYSTLAVQLLRRCARRGDVQKVTTYRS
uniref:Uncharacterized protein n=1 Tax=Arundo donax TaxID=35708 RepID=A0A0A9BWZ8_ARUDO